MKSALLYLRIVGIALLILLIGGLVWAGFTGQLLNVLYIILIFLAFFSLLSTALLIYAVIVLIQTIVVVRDEMKPLLASVQETVVVARETVAAVRETAQHAGKTAGTLASTAMLTREFAVAPTVRAAAMVLAGREMVKVVAGRGQVQKRAEKRRQRQEKNLRESVEGGE